MPGPQPLPIVLSPALGSLLRQLLRRHSLSQTLANRVRIVLAAAEGHSNAEIEQELRVGPSTVWQWRKRFHEALPSLQATEGEKPGDEKALREALLEVLGDRPRSGRPPVFSAEQLTQIIAIACEHVEDTKQPIDQLVAREVAEEAVKRGIVESISPRHVQRFFPRGRSETAQDQAVAHAPGRGD